MTSNRERLCAEEIFAGGFLNNNGVPTRRLSRILVFRGKHAVHAMAPIIGTANVSVSYVSEKYVLSALTTLFADDFEFQYIQ